MVVFGFCFYCLSVVLSFTYVPMIPSFDLRQTFLRFNVIDIGLLMQAGDELYIEQIIICVCNSCLRLDH
jgi:hypothetical protein